MDKWIKDKIENMKDCNFKNQYMQEYREEVFKSENVYCCGECKFYSNGCITSEIERKYGNANTPSCTEFSKRIVK